MSEIGYAAVVAVKLPDDRTTISFQLNFEIGASAAAINAELDKLIGCFERQASKQYAVSLEQQLEAKKRNLETQKDQIQQFQRTIEAAGNDTTRRVQNLPQVQTNLDNALTTYEKMQDEIKWTEAKIAEEKQKAA